jgi:uncharacterized protein (TIGR03000 family)
MYSIVMLTALAPGADVTPAPAAPVGCHGFAAAGCTGFGSCYGSCFGSCYGSRHGCHGGGIFGHRKGGGFLGHHKSCHGCQGYSCSGYNCFGSCFGSCLGAGCQGACYGGGAAVGGMSVGRPSVAMPAYSLYNYADPIAVYGRVTNIHPVSNPSAPVPMIPPVPPADEKQVAAKIKFQLPAEARLYVDGKLTLLTGSERAFSTPPLAVGEKFFYDVKAELVVGGQSVVEERRVVVEAGANLTESFPKLLTAAKTSGIAVAGK